MAYFLGDQREFHRENNPKSSKGVFWSHKLDEFYLNWDSLYINGSELPARLFNGFKVFLYLGFCIF